MYRHENEVKENMVKIISPFIGILILTFFISCKKDKYNDERNDVVGDYIGIKVIIQYFNDSTAKYDTSNITMTLLKSSLDSVINVNFVPPIDEFLFKYHNGEFIPISGYYPALIMSSDSLFFYYRPGLGPYWINCFTKKNE